MTERNYTIGFMNRAQVTLYEAELKGQISDGNWENSLPHNHWETPCRAVAFIAESPEKLGVDFDLIRYYDFANKELLQVVADRMIGFVKYYSLFINLDPMYAHHWDLEPLHSVADLESFFNTLERVPHDEYWQKKKVFIMELHGITEPMDLFTIAQRVQSVPYDMQALRKDLHEMKKIMHCRQAGFRGFVDGNFVANGTPEKSATIFQASCNRAAPVVTAPKGRRPYLNTVRILLESGRCTSREIVDGVMDMFPGLSRSGVQTFVTDLKNPKYTAFKDKKVVADEFGVLKFQE